MEFQNQERYNLRTCIRITQYFQLHFHENCSFDIYKSWSFWFYTFLYCRHEYTSLSFETVTSFYRSCTTANSLQEAPRVLQRELVIVPNDFPSATQHTGRFTFSPDTQQPQSSWQGSEQICQTLQVSLSSSDAFKHRE